MGMMKLVVVGCGSRFEIRNDLELSSFEHRKEKEVW